MTIKLGHLLLKSIIMDSLTSLEETKLNFLEFLKPKHVKTKTSVQDAVLNLNNLMQHRKVRTLRIQIPTFYDEFEEFLLKLEDYYSKEVLLYLIQVKYILTERVVSCKETIGKLSEITDSNLKDLKEFNIEFYNLLVTFTERGIRFIEYQLMLLETKINIPTENINKEEVEEIKTMEVEKRNKRIKLELNQFEFALLLTIFKEMGVFSDFRDRQFSEKFAQVFIDNFLCLKSNLFEPPKSLQTIFSHVYSHESRRKLPFKNMKDDIERAFITLAEKNLVDISNIKFNPKKIS